MNKEAMLQSQVTNLEAQNARIIKEKDEIQKAYEKYNALWIDTEKDNEDFREELSDLKAELQTAKKCNDWISRQLKELEWISVKHELPEEQEHKNACGHSVAVWCYYSNLGLPERQSHGIPDGYHTDIYHLPTKSWMSGVTPTHWMSIPKLEPPSCNPVGDECDQDCRDKGRIVELEAALAKHERPSIKPDSRCDGCGTAPPSRCTEGDCPVFLEIKDEAKKDEVKNG